MGIKIRKVSNVPGQYTFYCPGCKCHHAVYIQGEAPGPGPRWQWNGSVEKPTFSPSLLIRTGHYDVQHKGTDCWCTYNKEHPEDPAPFLCVVCHSFIRDGRIEYLSDCTHELRGHTVEMQDEH